jgi:transcriptional regulator with XRE-family HTH domain
MPAYSDVTSVLDRQLLAQLGERLKLARIKRGLTAVALAKQVGISRTTLSAVEGGDPTPTIGTYLRVMSALGVAGDLAMVASGAVFQSSRRQASTRVEQGQPGVEIVVKAADAQHEAQDLQSLMLHKEAIRLFHERPALIRQALDTLDKWRSSGDSHSRVLWDEWAVILQRKEWRKALARTRRAKELRQASPLPVVLPPEVRQSVLDQVRQLKKGVMLRHPATDEGLPR